MMVKISYVHKISYDFYFPYRMKFLYHALGRDQFTFYGCINY